MTSKDDDLQNYIIWGSGLGSIYTTWKFAQDCSGDTSCTDIEAVGRTLTNELSGKEVPAPPRINSSFQKHPVKLMSYNSYDYKQLLQQCLDAGQSQEYCHKSVCSLDFVRNEALECNDYPVGTYQHDVQDCVLNKRNIDPIGNYVHDDLTGESSCHTYVCKDLERDYPECDESEDDTLEYILLFVIIGLVCYGGYKYFKK